MPLFDTAEQIHFPEITFPTDYTSILNRIDAIDPVVYARSRNHLHGAVTYLSPYLSRGVISLTQVQASVLRRGYAPRQVEKFLQELAWREYFQRVWQAKGEAMFQDLKQVQADVAHYELPEALLQATTGIHAIDAAITHLYKTGYMHNHVRMYTASLACNMGKAYWQQPAQWLYHHLLDGDLASNTCSWQWVSGAFASKKYYCNQENINTYTGSKQRNSFLDQSYEQIVSAKIPDSLEATVPFTATTRLPDTPPIMLDTNLPTLLYNSYNLDPEWEKTTPANRVLLLEPTHFAQYPVSEKVVAFVIALAQNIPGIQLYCGELNALQQQYEQAGVNSSEVFRSKEHPAFRHYPGRKDPRDWLYPEVTGYYPSFFSFWKKAARYL
jgi:deoxyribodipyrimidine photo-lyase